jgi:hypothetical protein
MGNTQAMSPADLAFVHEHASRWVSPNTVTEAAEAYADWYVAEYGDNYLEDLPSHPSAWERFLETHDL